MIRGRALVNFAKQRFLSCSQRQLSFEADTALETVRESEVKTSLRNVIDAASGRNLVMTGSVQGIRVDKKKHVKINLDLFVPGHPHAEKIKEDCQRAISAIPWVTTVDVNILLKKPMSSSAAMGSSLRNVEHVIAVSSCKGGVGKSTVAVNLASELVKRGLRVGLLDADIFGAVSGLKILSFGHVNPRSGAPGAGGKGPAVMRGPIATRVITQLVTATEWGALDYLIVDMPPGTGDVQITLAQCITFTGAVIVTTPHELSLADATKGVAMFQDLRIPTLAVVENMSFFECDLGTRYHPFGEGGRDNLLRALKYAAGMESDPELVPKEKKGCGSSSSSSSSGAGETPTPTLTPIEKGGCNDPSHDHSHTHNHNETALGEGETNKNSSSSSSSNSSSNSNNSIGIPTGTGTLYERLSICPLHCVPLSRDVSRNFGAQSGYKPPTPVVLGSPDSKAANVYSALTDDVIIEVLKLQLEAQGTPSLSLLQGRGLVVRYYTATQALEYIIPSIELRVRDPATGLLLADHQALRSKLASVVPVLLDFKGNYGVAINWSDGHFADIFPFDVLRQLGEDLENKNTK